MANLNQASWQWATRPDDERFWTIAELDTYVHDRKESARQKTTNMNDWRFIRTGGFGAIESKGTTLSLTDWSLGQLCSKTRVPRALLSRLSPALGSQVIQESIRTCDEPEVTALADVNKMSLRAITSNSYQRVWDTDLVQAAWTLYDSGNWVVPPGISFGGPRCRPATEEDCMSGSRVKVGDLIGPSGLYASDRDIFIFMVTSQPVIDDGGQGLRRGFFLSNSETGARSLSLTTFLFEEVCGNHIVWSASAVTELKAIHRGKKVETVLRSIVKPNGLLANYHTLAASAEEDQIRKAQVTYLGDTPTEAMAYASSLTGLSLTNVRAIFSLGQNDTRFGDPATVWGFCQAMTCWSQQRKHADSRLSIDVNCNVLMTQAL